MVQELAINCETEYTVVYADYYTTNLNRLCPNWSNAKIQIHL